MIRESVWFGRRSERGIMLLVVVIAATANSALAGVKTRMYNFENGTPGNMTTVADNSIVGPFKDVPNEAFGAPYDFYDIAPPNILDGTLLGDWAAGTYNPSPDLTAADVGLPTYVNVANGSPLDSPAQGSNVGLQFNGQNTILQGQGFRASFISDAAVATNAPAVNDFTDENNFNIARSFNVLSQAWVRPTLNGGLSQVVWTVGNENGGVRITTDGFWELIALGPPGTRVTTQPVSFNQWTHLAVLRTGGEGRLYVNGTLATTAGGFFNAFGNFVTLGASESLSEPFNGVIDNFSLTGTGGLGITISTDVDVFSDLGLPTPSGVPGDVDQDGDADQTDYNIWSANAGFDNAFGQGDLTTLIKGDLDQNGKVNFFDFRIIARQAAAAGAVLSLTGGGVPEPTGGVLFLIGLAALTIFAHVHSRAR
jgi:hypothetical protein